MPFRAPSKVRAFPRSKALSAELCSWTAPCVVGSIVNTYASERRTAAAGCTHQVLLDFGLQLAQQNAGNDPPQSHVMGQLLNL
jgi:hypothetical protein